MNFDYPLAQGALLGSLVGLVYRAIMLMSLSAIISCASSDLCLSGDDQGLLEPVSGMCLVDLRADELAYAQRVLRVKGSHYPGMTLRIYGSLMETTELFLGPVPEGKCIGGFNTGTDIHTTTTSLNHELVHSDIRQRTSGVSEGSTHDARTGWNTEDDERIRALDALSPPPYKPTSGCSRD